MAEGRIRRRLAAVLALDVVGYSRLMAADEAGTYSALVECQKTILEPLVKTHAGRVVKLMGDGALVEFQSVVDAVECGIAIQAGFAERNTHASPDKAIHVRIGINLGDIIIDKGDIFGDGVNVAARLEAMADPGGICIAGSVYDQVKSKIDVGFEDLGEQSVKNIAEPVRVYRIGGEAMPAPAAAAPAAPSSNRPSIAVLPFDNLSGDAKQQYFCDGVSEDLTTALSRFDWLFVAARNAAFRYKGQPVDVRKVGRELGVRYMLEGSIRVAGSRARVNVQMIETDRQGHVWADRLGADITDPLEIQDEIVARIASTVGPEITHAEIERAKNKSAGSLDQWDHYMLGYTGFYAMTPDSIDAAMAHFKTAIELDAGFANAYALLGLCHGHAASRGWERPAKQGYRRAHELVTKAVRLSPTSTEANFAVAWVLMMTGRAREAVTIARRTIQLNPYYADGYTTLGHCLILCGDLSEGLSCCEQAARSKPRDARGSWLLDAMGDAHFFLGDYEKAIEVSQLAIHQDPSMFGARVTLACANARLGRKAEARRHIDHLVNDIPRFSVQAVRKNPIFVDPRLVDDMIESLRIAGLPEEAPARAAP